MGGGFLRQPGGGLPAGFPEGLSGPVQRLGRFGPVRVEGGGPLEQPPHFGVAGAGGFPERQYLLDPRPVLAPQVAQQGQAFVHRGERVGIVFYSFPGFPHAGCGLGQPGVEVLQGLPQGVLGGVEAAHLPEYRHRRPRPLPGLRQLLAGFPQQLPDLLGVAQAGGAPFQLGVLADPEPGLFDLLCLIGEQVLLPFQGAQAAPQSGAVRLQLPDPFPGRPVFLQRLGRFQAQIDQAPEGAGPGQRQGVVLPDDLHPAVELFGQRPGRNHPAVDVGPAAAGVDAPGGHHLPAVQDEPSLHRRFGAAGADEAGPGGGAGEQPEGAQQQRLARPGLSADHHHAGAGRDPGR